MAVDANATTTKIEHTSADVMASATTITVCLWLYRDGAGEGSAGRVFCLSEAGEAAAPFFVIKCTSTANRYQISKNFGTTNGLWRFDAPDGQWNAIAISYDWGDVANNPTVRVNFTDVTVTETTAPVGTIGSNPLGYCWLNQSNQSFTFDGGAAWGQVFNTILSEKQDQALRFPGSVRPVRLFTPMDVPGRAGRDLSGNGFDGTETDVGARTPGPHIALPAWCMGFDTSVLQIPAGGFGGLIGSGRNRLVLEAA